MNKIFKIVWSSVRQCYVVTSEFAKRQTKGCSVAKLFSNRRALKGAAAVVMAGALVGISGVGEAVDRGTNYIDTDEVVYGYNNKSDYDTDTKAVTIGLDNGVTVYEDAQAVSVGVDNLAYSDKEGISVAFGVGNDSDANRMSYSVALGVNNTSSTEKMGDAVSVGVGNTSDAGKKTSVSMGAYNKAGVSAVALGISNKATNEWGVAMGRGNYAGYEGISVGNGNNSSSLEWLTKYKDMDKNVISINLSNYDSVASDLKDGEYPYIFREATAVGFENYSYGDKSTAVGYRNLAAGKSSTAIGNNNLALNKETTAIGAQNEANNKYAVAVGYHNRADNESTSAIGKDNRAMGKMSSAVGYGNTATGESSAAIGKDNHSNSKFGAAIGVKNEVVEGSADWIGSAAMGYGNYAEGSHAVAIGSENGIDASYSVGIGYDNETSSDYAILVGISNSVGVEGGLSGAWSSVAMGDENTVKSKDAAAIGVTNAIGKNSMSAVAIGSHNEVYDDSENSVAMGYGNDVSESKNASSVGVGNYVSGDYATAVGYGNDATGSDSVAIGSSNEVNGHCATAVGTYNSAEKNYANAFGNDNHALDYSSTALGIENYARGIASTAVGASNEAYSKYTTAMGWDNEAKGESATAVGSENFVDGGWSAAVGYQNTVKQAEASAIGVLNTAEEDQSSAVGFKNVASGSEASAFGYDNKAVGYSAAMGHENNASAVWAAAIGVDNNASAKNSTAVGYKNTAYGESSTAVGARNKADVWATAVGSDNEATLDNAVAIGSGNKATNLEAVAIGYSNEASGDESLALGIMNHATGNYSIAIGGDSYATKVYSMALGRNSKASADYSVAIGTNAQATVANSVALGANALANTAAVGTASATIAGTTYNFAGTAPVGTVSVGQAGKERTITNVAAGRVTATSTDAINGSQLYAVANTLTAKTNIGNTDNNIVVTPGNAGTNVDLADDVHVNKSVSITKPENKKTTTTTMTYDGVEVVKANDDGSSESAEINHNTIVVASTDKKGVVKETRITATKVQSGQLFGSSQVYAGTLSGEDGEIFTKMNKDQFEVHDKNSTSGDPVSRLTKDTLEIGNYNYITKTGIHANDKKITNVADGEISATSTDAVNGSQLYALEQKVGNMTDTNTTYTVGFNGDGAGAVTLDEIGKVDADGNPVPGITILKAADGLKIYQENGINYIGLDIEEIENDNMLGAPATAFVADDEKQVGPNDAGVLAINGGADKDSLTEKNIGVVSNAAGDGLEVKLSKDINLTDNGSLTIGATKIDNSGVSVDGKKYITKDGLNANDKKITNVADGEISANSKDAVNGSQLYKMQADNAQMNQRINETNDRVNRVGAGAAALAALHPQAMRKGESQVMAGLGRYKGKSGAAVGAAWQPSKNVMVNGGFADAAGEMMFNVGVSYKFGQKSYTVEELQAMNTGNGIPLYVAELNSVLESKDAKINALESDNKAMRAELNELKAVVAQLVKNAK